MYYSGFSKRITHQFSESSYTGLLPWCPMAMKEGSKGEGVFINKKYPNQTTTIATKSEGERGRPWVQPHHTVSK